MQPGWLGLQPDGQSDPSGSFAAAQQPGAGTVPASGFSFYFCVDTGVTLLSTAEEPIMGFGGVTGGLSAVPWLFFHHPVSVRGSGPKSSLHQAGARGSSVCGC